MNELKLFEQGLVPVYKTDTGKNVVNGRELWEGLQSKRQFADWVKSRILDCEAVEGEEFETISQNCENGGKRIEYIIKLDTAKEMAMLERNEIGKRVRKYFISVEKKSKKPMSSLEFAELQLKISKELDQKIDTVNEDLQAFKLDLPLLGVECDKITTAVRLKGVHCLGGKASIAYHDKSLRQKVYSDIYREIKRQFGLSSYKAIKRSQCDIAVEIISEYKLPLVLWDEIADCNSQESIA